MDAFEADCFCGVSDTGFCLEASELCCFFGAFGKVVDCAAALAGKFIKLFECNLCLCRYGIGIGMSVYIDYLVHFLILNVVICVDFVRDE